MITGILKHTYVLTLYSWEGRGTKAVCISNEPWVMDELVKS